MDSIEQFQDWILYSEEHPITTFDDFLANHRPSNKDMIGVRWIAVSTASINHVAFKDEQGLGKTTLGVGARAIEADLSAKIRAIESDKNIPQNPTRWNRKTKKYFREKEYTATAAALKKLAVEQGHVTGKWLLYPMPEEVDEMWAKIAKAIIEPDGALRGKVFTAKVSPVPDDTNGRQLICVFTEDSWDLPPVGNTYRALVQDLGLQPSSYKADVYNMAGIGLGHPSKMKHFLYGQTVFMTKEAITAAIALAGKRASEATTHDDSGTALEGPISNANAGTNEQTEESKPGKRRLKRVLESNSDKEKSDARVSGTSTARAAASKKARE